MTTSVMDINGKKQIWVDKDFEKNARKAFPYKSMYEITKQLNKLLEDALHQTKKK